LNRGDSNVALSSVFVAIFWFPPVSLALLANSSVVNSGHLVGEACCEIDRGERGSAYS